jgi:hypothetical protein
MVLGHVLIGLRNWYNNCVGFVGSIRQHGHHRYVLDADQILRFADIFNREDEDASFPSLNKDEWFRSGGREIWSGMAGAKSANVQKGRRITAPATVAATRTQDVTNFSGSNMFVSYFRKNRSNLTPRILRETVP